MDIIKSLLDKTQPILDHLVEREKTLYRKNDRIYTAFDEKCTRLGAQIKLLQSLHKHLQKDDILVNATFKIQAGNLVMELEFIRDNKNEFITTEVIIAGGYNIQKAHYRYITKSSIKRKSTPNIENAQIKALALKLKVTQKEAKLHKENEKFNKQIKENQEKLDTLNNFTFDQQVRSMGSGKEDNVYKRILSKSWETFNYEREINPCYMHTTIHNEDQYNEYIESIKNEIIKIHESNIHFTSKRIQQLHKYIAQNNTKIEKLQNSCKTQLN